MFGKPRLDQAPAHGEIRVAGRQRPDTMKVIEQNHRRIDRTVRNAVRNVATFRSSANNGLRSAVTTVKKNVPPVKKARRYCIGAFQKRRVTLR